MCLMPDDVTILVLFCRMWRTIQKYCQMVMGTQPAYNVYTVNAINLVSHSLCMSQVTNRTFNICMDSSNSFICVLKFIKERKNKQNTVLSHKTVSCEYFEQDTNVGFGNIC
jgi:hypothetical protein